MRRHLLTALLILAAGGCSQPGDGTGGFPPCGELSWTGEPVARSVVFVMGDTLRRDRLGAYGGTARTPAFDAFAASHLLFERAFSQAPWTKPSIATLFTSLYPSQHRLALHPTLEADRDGEGMVEADALGPGFTTLAEVLRASGYQTAAFVANPWMKAGFGFDQGFDVYDDSFAAFDAPGGLVSDAGLAWLEDRTAESPFFLYLHYMDPHRPYPALTRAEIEARAESLRAAPPVQSEKQARELTQLVRLEGGGSILDAGVPLSWRLLELAYDKGVEQFDAALGRFLDGLSLRPDAEEVAVVVTSDHGEALYARGYGNHGLGLFDDEIAVPLAARLPGVSAPDGRVACAVGLIDVLPTLCTYLGVSCPETVFGRSLLPGPAAEDRPRYVVSEGVGGKPDHRALRGEQYKLLWEPTGAPHPRAEGQTYSLFHVAQDPEERRDLLAPEARDTRAERVLRELAPRLRDAVAPFDPPEAETRPVDEALGERLRALGYGE